MSEAVQVRNAVKPTAAQRFAGVLSSFVAEGRCVVARSTRVDALQGAAQGLVVEFLNQSTAPCHVAWASASVETARVRAEDIKKEVAARRSLAARLAGLTGARHHVVPLQFNSSVFGMGFNGLVVDFGENRDPEALDAPHLAQWVSSVLLSRRMPGAFAILLGDVESPYLKVLQARWEGVSAGCDILTLCP